VRSWRAGAGPGSTRAPRGDRGGLLHDDERAEARSGTARFDAGGGANRCQARVLGHSRVRVCGLSGTGRAQPRSGGAAQRAAALSTLMRWTYEPAREGGTPVASVRREVLEFTGGYTSRLTLASPPEECAPRIRAALVEKHSRVVLHPDGNGLVIVGKPREGQTFREVRLDLVRWGPEADGRGTGIATASRSLIEYLGLTARTEGALAGADARLRGVGRKIAIPALTVGRPGAFVPPSRRSPRSGPLRSSAPDRPEAACRPGSGSCPCSSRSS